MPKSIAKLRLQRSKGGGAAQSAAEPYATTVAVVSGVSSWDKAAAAGNKLPENKQQHKKSKKKERLQPEQWQPSAVMAQQLKNGIRETELEQRLKASGVEIKPAAVSLSNKIKSKVAVREAERMKAVAEHPAFQQDPFAAVHEHLLQMAELRKKGSRLRAEAHSELVRNYHHTVSAAAVSIQKQPSTSHLKRERKKINKAKQNKMEEE
jgi:hypothetical protein